MDSKKQIKPLTSTPHPPTTIQEFPTTDAHKWYFIVGLCGICSFAVGILGIIMLIRSFALFEIKDPTLAVNTIYFNDLQISVSTPNHSISINASLTADISVENPNLSVLQFDSSMTIFYYSKETVGIAYAPWSEVPAHGTLRMNATVDVLADRLSMLTNATASAMKYGCLNLTSYTYFQGRITALKLFNRNVKVMMNCSMTLDLPLSPQQVKNKICQAYVE